MDMGRFLIEMHLRAGRPIKELARTHGVSTSWLFKLLRRYRLEGEDGLALRTRRPRRSPSRITHLDEDEVVALRKELVDAGYDGGAETIHFHLSARHPQAPSVSTIWRILKARGFVIPQPPQAPEELLRPLLRRSAEPPRLVVLPHDHPPATKTKQPAAFEATARGRDPPVGQQAQRATEVGPITGMRPI